jgi:hypothetical protein
VTASLKPWIARTLAGLAVATAALPPARAADTAPDLLEAAASEGVLEEGLVLSPLVETESIEPLGDEPPRLVEDAELLPGPAPLATSPIGEDAVVQPPALMDVSALDGMLIDDGALDEMPFEASSGRWFWNGGWYVGGESLWMDRSRNNRTRIVADVGAPNTSYTTFAQPFNVAPGARATIGKSLGRDYLDRDRFIEFIYYGGMTYEDTDGWNGVFGNSLYTPLFFDAPGFNGASRYTTNFNSDFNSWEWNYKLRRRLGRDQLVMSPGGNWTRHAERGWLPALIIGTRLVNVNEDFRFTSDRPGTSTDEFGGRYVINAGNWLLGANLGGELISQNEFYYWGLRGRAAPALSFASTSQSATGVNNTPPDPGPLPPAPTGVTNFSDEATRTGAGFIGDLTVFAGWQINPNFSLQVGYDFLWVAGMATATRQFNLDNRDNNAIDVGGQTFYNGLSFGFYGSW